jgi:uncharacterized protein HemX
MKWMKVYEPTVLLTTTLVIALAAVIGTCSLCYWKDRAQRAEATARAQDAQAHATLAARNREIARYQGDLATCQDAIETLSTECHETERALSDCQIKCIERFVDRAIEQGVRVP